LFGFLGIALLLNVLDYSTFIARLPIAVVIVALLYVMYRIGQMGGADVMILASIYAALPAIQSPLISSPPITDFFGLPSIFPVLVISTFLFSIAMVVRYLPTAIEKTINGKLKLSNSAIIQTVIIVAAYGVMFYMMGSLFGSVISPAYMIFLGFVGFVTVFFLLFKDLITESFVKWTKNAEVEDVIFLEKVNKSLVKKYNLQRLITEEQLKKMNKLKIKWPVLDLPMFLPYILLALIIYILIGDPILYPL